jgi:DNA polymerase elongation subunit (family B)
MQIFAVKDKSSKEKEIFLSGYFYGGGQEDMVDLHDLREHLLDVHADSVVSSAINNVLNAEYSIRYLFFLGFYAASSVSGPEAGEVRFSCGWSKKVAAEMYYLVRSFGAAYDNKIYITAAPYLIRIVTLTPEEDRDVVHSISVVSSEVEQYVYDLETDAGVFHAGIGELVVKNTDSIFINFHPKNTDGTPMQGVEALTRSIEMGKEAGNRIKPLLRKPHDLEYEKTFWPLILFSKKRYAGNKYEEDPKKFKLTSMGIVLKRRDNAPILKHIYADVIDVILNQKNIPESIACLHRHLQHLLEGTYPLEYLIISKSLRSHYENPDQIVHRALADRIAERDPGNKPQPNDRIPYVYIDVKKKVTLQGDRVEHPEYIRKHGLKPDYVFYVTNQVMKPICKIYALVLEELEGFKRPKEFYATRYKELLLAKNGDEEKARKRLEEERMRDVQLIIFEPILRRPIRMQKNAREGNQEISKWFKSS